MRWNILSIEDDVDIGRQIKKFLDGQINKGQDELYVEVMNDFDEALKKLDTMLYDLVILDVFKGKVGLEIHNRPGKEVLDKIRDKCFVPIIFYTALPAAVDNNKSSLIHIVPKTAGGLKELKKKVILLIKNGLPAINRILINHFFKIQAEYMWGFVEPKYKEIRKTADIKELAYILARRLAISLTRDNLNHLIVALGGTVTGATRNDMVYPIEFYIFPPITTQYQTGDIVSKSKKGPFYIILTPTCDMVKDGERSVKTDYILVAKCVLLSSADEVKTWQKNKNDNNVKGSIKSLIKNNRKGRQGERFYFIPGTFFIPNLFVDFQMIFNIPYKDMNTYRKLTTLDSPFAECLLNRFSRYIGRIGTPDLASTEIDTIIEKL